MEEKNKKTCVLLRLGKITDACPPIENAAMPVCVPVLAAKKVEFKEPKSSNDDMGIRVRISDMEGGVQLRRSPCRLHQGLPPRLLPRSSPEPNPSCELSIDRIYALIVYCWIQGARITEVRRSILEEQ